MLAHKIALMPTPAQEAIFRKAAGIARFSYNWALTQWQNLYASDKAAGIKPERYFERIRKRHTAIKKTEWPWMSEVHAGIANDAIRNVGRAFGNFFNGSAGFPRYKKKHRCPDSFRGDGNGTPEYGLRFSGRYVRFAKLGGTYVRMAEKIRFEGKIQRVVIKRDGPRWFAIFVVDTEVKPIVRENQATVGIDLGLTHFAVTSDGQKFEAPKPMAKAQHKLAKVQRRMDRRVTGSGRHARAAKAVGKIHYRVANIRRDFQNKLSSMLTRRYALIGIEGLDVATMRKNRSLSKAIQDVGWGEFRRQIKYKAALYEARVVVADRYYPSSKTCSDCGHALDKLAWETRAWTCPQCGAHHDRDINAAKNLANVALRADRPEVTRGETAASTPKPSRSKSGRRTVKSNPKGTISVEGCYGSGL